jgi:hypothetical protein
MRVRMIEPAGYFYCRAALYIENENIEIAIYRLSGRHKDDLRFIGCMGLILLYRYRNRIKIQPIIRIDRFFESERLRKREKNIAGEGGQCQGCAGGRAGGTCGGDVRAGSA